MTQAAEGSTPNVLATPVDARPTMSEIIVFTELELRFLETAGDPTHSADPVGDAAIIAIDPKGVPQAAQNSSPTAENSAASASQAQRMKSYERIMRAIIDGKTSAFEAAITSDPKDYAKFSMAGIHATPDTFEYLFNVHAKATDRDTQIEQLLYALYGALEADKADRVQLIGLILKHLDQLQDPTAIRFVVLPQTAPHLANPPDGTMSILLVNGSPGMIRQLVEADCIADKQHLANMAVGLGTEAHLESLQSLGLTGKLDDKAKKTLLYLAVKYGVTDGFNRLMADKSARFDLDVILTALTNAAFHHRLEFATRLIGPLRRVKDSKSPTSDRIAAMALGVAAHQGDLQIVRLLVDEGLGDLEWAKSTAQQSIDKKRASLSIDRADEVKYAQVIDFLDARMAAASSKAPGLISRLLHKDYRAI